ncbi:hypothetical protein ACOME3_000819 [Neoechinorhynchus agilis]
MTINLSSLLRTNSSFLRLALVASFNPLVTAAVKSRVPNVLTALSYRPSVFRTNPEIKDKLNFAKYYWFTALDLLMGYCVENVFWLYIGCEFILLHRSLMCSDVVEKWAGRNIQTIYWVVNLDHEQIVCHEMGCPVIANKAKMLAHVVDVTQF